MTYAAYLRIYEAVSAFHEPDRSRWAAYAASAAAIDGAARGECEFAAGEYWPDSIPEFAVMRR